MNVDTNRLCPAKESTSSNLHDSKEENYNANSNDEKEQKTERRLQSECVAQSKSLS